MSFFGNNSYIDIEYHLLSFLNFKSLKKLYEVNHYYNSLIKNYPKTKKYYDFFCIDRYRTLEEVIKNDDYDIFVEFNLKNEKSNIELFDIFVKLNAINILDYYDSYDNDYQNIINNSIKYDNVSIFKKYDYLYPEIISIRISNIIQKDAVNIFTEYFAFDTNIDNEIIDEIYIYDAGKIFKKFINLTISDQDTLSDIFDSIILNDDINIFMEINIYKYEEYIINALGSKYAPKIFDFLLVIDFINKNNFMEIFSRILLEKKDDEAVSNMESIEYTVIYSYMEKLMDVANKIGVDFNVSKLNLKDLLIGSVKNNNYVAIKFIYDSSFEYKEYDFPEPYFNNEILFRIARKNKFRWISKIFLHHNYLDEIDLY